MTQLSERDHCLSGAERNFRTPGKKLLPRDSYNAFLRERFKSMRQVRKEIAIEVAAYDSGYGERMHYERIARLRKSLSTRAQKLVQFAAERDTADSSLSSAFRQGMQSHCRQKPARSRLYRAYMVAHSINQAETADDRMLRNAY